MHYTKQFLLVKHFEQTTLGHKVLCENEPQDEECEVNEAKFW